MGAGRVPTGGRSGGAHVARKGRTARACPHVVREGRRVRTIPVARAVGENVVPAGAHALLEEGEGVAGSGRDHQLLRSGGAWDREQDEHQGQPACEGHVGLLWAVPSNGTALHASAPGKCRAQSCSRKSPAACQPACIRVHISPPIGSVSRYFGRCAKVRGVTGSSGRRNRREITGNRPVAEPRLTE